MHIQHTKCGKIHLFTELIPQKSMCVQHSSNAWTSLLAERRRMYREGCGSETVVGQHLEKQARVTMCRLNIPSGRLCVVPLYRTEILVSTATYGLFLSLANGNIWIFIITSCSQWFKTNLYISVCSLTLQALFSQLQLGFSRFNTFFCCIRRIEVLECIFIVLILKKCS